MTQEDMQEALGGPLSWPLRRGLTEQHRDALAGVVARTRRGRHTKPDREIAMLLADLVMRQTNEDIMAIPCLWGVWKAIGPNGGPLRGVDIYHLDGSRTWKLRFD